MSTQEVFQKLSEKVGSGEIIDIVYLGGSRPGAVRKVVVQSVTKSRLRAVDVANHVPKTFMLDKVVYPVDVKNIPSVEWKGSEHFSSLADILKKYEKLFLEKKLTPVLDDDALMLFESFKNGKMKKSPFASLVYEEFIDEVYLDPETFEEFHDRRKRVLPYIVRSKHDKTRSYGSLDRAVVYFIEVIAPNWENNRRLVELREIGAITSDE